MNLIREKLIFNIFNLNTDVAGFIKFKGANNLSDSSQESSERKGVAAFLEISTKMKKSRRKRVTRIARSSI